MTSLGVGPAWRAATPPDPAWLAERDLPERYLLFVGNREPRKNLPTLLTAYRDLLASRVPGGVAGPPGDLPPLVLVGPPGWGEALDLAGLPPEAVRTPGYLPEDDLARVVAGAAALISAAAAAISAATPGNEEKAQPVQMITAEELKTKVDNNERITILDVRSASSSDGR